jgi:hypothetical protein
MQKQRSPGSIYTGIIKNTYRSTFESYIKELLVQKYWQLISTKQLWSVPNIVSSKSRTVQYRVPRCPSQYRNVHVPSCPGTEMSRIRAKSPFSIGLCPVETYKNKNKNMYCQFWAHKGQARIHIKIEIPNW